MALAEMRDGDVAVLFYEKLGPALNLLRERRAIPVAGFDPVESQRAA